MPTNAPSTSSTPPSATSEFVEQFLADSILNTTSRQQRALGGLFNDKHRHTPKNPREVWHQLWSAFLHESEQLIRESARKG